MAVNSEVLSFDEKVRTRLKDIIDNDFPNREAAAIVAGKDKDMLARYITGKSTPPFNTIISLLRFKGISFEWLVYGRGNKYEKDNVIIKHNTTAIKIYDISVSAGPGCFVDDEFVHSEIVLSDEFLKLYELSSSCVGVFIKGDSMKPKLLLSDTAIVDTGITTFEDDNIYVFSYENHCYIKQLQKIGREIKIKSLNSDYENWSLIPEEEGDKFKIVGKLKLIIRKP